MFLEHTRQYHSQIVLLRTSLGQKCLYWGVGLTWEAQFNVSRSNEPDKIIKKCVGVFRKFTVFMDSTMLVFSHTGLVTKLVKQACYCTSNISKFIMYHIFCIKLVVVGMTQFIFHIFWGILLYYHFTSSRRHWRLVVYSPGNGIGVFQ